MWLFYEGFPDEGFQVDQVVYGSSLFQNLVIMLVIRPFDSKYYVSLFLIIHPIVLQRLIVNAMGQ